MDHFASHASNIITLVTLVGHPEVIKLSRRKASSISRSNQELKDVPSAGRAAGPIPPSPGNCKAWDSSCRAA